MRNRTKVLIRNALILLLITTASRVAAHYILQFLQYVL